MIKIRLLVSLTGKQEEIIESLIKNGYFNTKSEVVRAGIRELAEKYNLIGE